MELVLLVGLFAVAWVFGGLMKTGGVLRESLWEAPWGAVCGALVWLVSPRRWREPGA